MQSTVATELACFPFRRPTRSGMTPIERVQAIGWDVTEGGCWEWRGERMARGARARVYTPEGRRYAYRVTYEAINGPIPEGLVACHTCHNPTCINPGHIIAETQAHNMHMEAERVRVKPDRLRRDADRDRRIHALYETGHITMVELARAFKMDAQTVAQALARVARAASPSEGVPTTRCQNR